MDLLEQPLEAVAFRIYSLPEAAAAGAAAWTCLAAVLAAAAAAGVWRLRSSTTADFADAPKPLVMETSASPTSSSRETTAEPTASSSPAPSPKERYTAYYHDTGCVGCCVVESDEELEEEELNLQDDDGVHGPWKKEPFEWEVVKSLVPLVARSTADEYRSPRALSGSVVRLWDQGAELGLTAAMIPRRRTIRAGTVSII
uniref:Uncharacterized protein n=1 Tax=Avena sativa TaxID=4498 RepID=A0ACD6APK8_AVESA